MWKDSGGEYHYIDVTESGSGGDTNRVASDQYQCYPRTIPEPAGVKRAPGAFPHFLVPLLILSQGKACVTVGLTHTNPTFSTGGGMTV